MSTKCRVVHALVACVLATLPAFASAHGRSDAHRAHRAHAHDAERDARNDRRDQGSTPRAYRPAGAEERCHEATREAPRTYRPHRFAPAGDRRVYRPRAGHTYRPQGNEAYRPRSR